MRILHVMNHVSDRGNGIVNLAVDLAIEQRKAGHLVTFASGHGGYEPLLQQYGITFYHLDQTRSPKQLFAACMEFRRILAEFEPEIIHAHMRVGLLISWLWSRARHIPLVAHLHNVHDKASILMGLADRIIAVSQSVSKSMQKQGIRQSKLRVVLNGTLNGARATQEGAVAPARLQRPAITTVAGMNHRKGIHELIAAFNMIAGDFVDSHLYLVGDGPERKLFEQLAAESPFRDRIHFEGFQSRPQAYLLSSDIFVLASRRESFGLVLSEARQAGCAIIATNVDGIPEALEDGKAGMLVPPRDPRALANALRLLLDNDELRRDWQNRARQNTEVFTTARMAEEVENVYLELTPATAIKMSL
ncbi:glycosyltransferase family 4 protein [Alloacidobacterium dinghuense]|uniref:Glycosyltransferase family 4 protein n=1 Tax=Alloacidobacterium dinghuense TaxID=2763107 RepID=A0A7G8BI74_9BACT|nr:glycosyltransferase family 4 protein [Alloacidobacterium dinghuense]QNI32244.1 glycosyltransferase family 4 protein [Alloacidobacterium dinghuense]